LGLFSRGPASRAARDLKVGGRSVKSAFFLDIPLIGFIER
jgi:hypothetical protein